MYDELICRVACVAIYVHSDIVLYAAIVIIIMHAYQLLL